VDGFEVAGTIRRAAQFHQAAPLEDAIKDRLGEIRVVEHQAPCGKRLVGGEQHRPAMQVTLVDDLEHEVGGVAADGQVTDLVDYEHRSVRVARERSGQLAAPGRHGERLDHLGGAGEQRLVAVLDGAIGDGDPEVGLAGARGSTQDQ